ncbi:hypothetical protein DAPPUDRAFT_100505 [Daphnia pulex]|uniref:Uncharacterized protein n=1 Tax=Daphnia pulex TaxID=6669 RepID=E9GAK1_DAPPU|nr:hypothetical protein DAPPUDRAFT_100505 [Daphnia pulex]|eukprot:EFX83513.1 hypothetical protein DAPPUDRAFT_100505 [Daphnia pulex]
MVEDMTQEFETSWAPHSSGSGNLVIEEKRVREKERKKKKGEKEKENKKEGGADCRRESSCVAAELLPADSNCASRSVSAGRAGSKNPTVSSDFLLLFSLLILDCCTEQFTKIPGNKNKLTLSSVIHFPPKVHSTQQFLSLTSRQQRTVPPKKALVENDGRRFETGPGPGPNQYQQFEE